MLGYSNRMLFSGKISEIIIVGKASSETIKAKVIRFKSTLFQQVLDARIPMKYLISRQYL